MLDLREALASFPTLTTERFLLRAVRESDAPDVLRILGDPSVVRYFGMAPMAGEAQARERIRWIHESFSQQSGVRWVICRRGEGRTDDRMIGSCGFWRIMKPHFRAEIGYELEPESWGQGVMPEALRAALAFGFETMGLHSVEAQIHPENEGSRRVLQKLGFRQEGQLRQNYYDPVEGAFTDTAVFGLLRSEWGAGDQRSRASRGDV